MADDSGGMGILGAVIGAAIVLAIGFFMLNNNLNDAKNLSLNITPPAPTSAPPSSLLPATRPVTESRLGAVR